MDFKPLLPKMAVEAVQRSVWDPALKAKRPLQLRRALWCSWYSSFEESRWELRASQSISASSSIATPLKSKLPGCKHPSACEKSLHRRSSSSSLGRTDWCNCLALCLASLLARSRQSLAHAPCQSRRTFHRFPGYELDFECLLLLLGSADCCYIVISG